MAEIAEIDVEIDDDFNKTSRKITPVDKLMAIIASDNPAEILDDEELSEIARDVLENFNQDLDSMEAWSSLVEEGQELMSQDFSARSEPWQGAANFKSPMIINAVLTFGDTASQELLRKSDIVKGMVIGMDPQGIKEKQASRVSTYMNYQLNVEMSEWRVEHDKLLYTLPSTGCMFKKTFFDPGLGRNISDVIFFPNFVVNQANTTIEDASSFTQILQFTENQVIEKMRSGQWLDSDFIVGTEEKEDPIVKDENREGQPEANQDRFLEQHAWFDLDDDGYKEPYVVTMHESSMTIVKIAPRFMPKDITVKVQGEVFSLAVLTQFQEVDSSITADEIVSIKPINLITKYDFLPDPMGEFLGIGYPHLLSGVSQAINTTTNHLLDAGTLSNLPGGYLAKGVRKKLGEELFQPGEWKGTNVPARDFQNAFFPLPYGEPSQTLFALNEKMQQEGERTANSADFSKVLANNAPATTTLALLQKETQSTTSIIRRIYLAMSDEFKKMAILNQSFVDPEIYQAVLDDPNANFEQDFDANQFNLVPISNPEMSTRIERIKSAEVQMNFLPQIGEAGGQTQVVIKGFLDALGIENIDQIFPEPQPEQIELQNQQLQQQNQLQEFQNNLFDRELAVRETDIQRKIAETQSKIAETRTEIIKIQSETLLNLEKAETEDQVNQLTTYTAELSAFVNLLGQLRQDNSANNQQAA